MRKLLTVLITLLLVLMLAISAASENPVSDKNVMKNSISDNADSNENIMKSTTAEKSPENTSSDVTLNSFFDSVFTLLFETNNVTLNGEAVFSLDGAEFKKADALYIQDEDSSFWQLKMHTPRRDGSICENGYTVIANGSKLYVMEVYHPGIYKTGTGTPQNTILRKSVQMNLMKDLACSVAAQAEALPGRKVITVEKYDKGTALRIRADNDLPLFFNDTLNVFVQFAAKRWFHTDYDQISEQMMLPMGTYLTVTEGILASTKSFSLEQADIRLENDANRQLKSVSGIVSVQLNTARDGKRMLDVSFSLDVSDRGQSHVDTFNPAEFGVSIADGAMKLDNLQFTDVAPDKAQKLITEAIINWRQAGFTPDENAFGTAWQENGRFHVELADSDGLLSLFSMTNEEGKILELRNASNIWQGEEVLSDAYLDENMVQEAADYVMAYLEQVNPEAAKQIEQFGLNWWLEKNGELFFEFCEEPIAQNWDGILIIVRVKPDWRIEYYSCFANG